MSYDIFLWSKKEPIIEQREIELEGYLLTADAPTPIEAEDVPIHILADYDGLSYLTVFCLRPITSDEVIIKKAKNIVTKYAKEYEGVVDDPQLPSPISKIKKTNLPRITRNSKTIEISFFSHTDKVLDDYLPAFVDLLEKYFPAALPKRYGAYEPPEFKYAEQGKNHFVSYLHINNDIVWYANKPVSYVFINDANKSYVNSKERRCNRITIKVLEEAYYLSNWKSIIDRFFDNACELLDVFYAQISNSSGVCAWWWRGIPITNSYRIAFGEPYISLLKLESSSNKNVVIIDDTSNIKIPRKFTSKKKRFYPKNAFGSEKYTKARVIPF